jgi:hypothetical protein
MTDGCMRLLYNSSSSISSQLGIVRKRQALRTVHHIRNHNILSSSQPGGPPCWASPLAFGLIGLWQRICLLGVLYFNWIFCLPTQVHRKSAKAFPRCLTSLQILDRSVSLCTGFSFHYCSISSVGTFLKYKGTVPQPFCFMFLLISYNSKPDAQRYVEANAQCYSSRKVTD